jgi:alpha-beta hydrolase superfamily lysophospholipase
MARALVGRYHAPAPEQARPVCAVLCNPLGYEALSVHRTMRHLGEHLAAHGVAALRFDYDGTGDSAGRADDPDRVAAWLASVTVAMQEVRERSGAERVALVGIRFGATLAAVAARSLAEVDDLVLWAPIVSGRTHVRELRAFNLLQSARSRPHRRTDGAEEIGGFFFGRGTLAAMGEVDLLARSARTPARVLVLAGGAPPVDEGRLVKHYAELGADARLMAETGYARMMRDDPYETVVPSETIDAITSWLVQGKEASLRPAPPRLARDTLAVQGAGGSAVSRETLVRFGPDDRLFGVVTEPAEARSPGRPAVVLLNVGANHEVGPHRMNVELARELSSLGYLALRFDVSGLGDSAVAPGKREHRIYDKDAVADVKAAMDQLGRMYDVHRFVLVGLCSGAYVAFHTTVEDPRVVGQALLSSYAFEWKEGDPVTPSERKVYDSTRSYLRGIFNRRVWVRAIRGEVDVRGIAGVLYERLMTQLSADLPRWSARLRGTRRRNTVERAFHDLCDRGVESLLASSFNDSGLDTIARYLGTDARRMRGRDNFSLRVLEGVDHTFTSLASQRVLSDILKEYLARLTARLAADG